MPTTDQLIENIFHYIENLGCSSKIKRPYGINLDRYVDLFIENKLDIPSEISKVYAICNGTFTEEGDKIGELQFLPGYFWMNIFESFLTYKNLIKETHWKKSWLPLFGNGGGDFYAIICDSKSNDFGSIVGYLRGETDHLVEFENLIKFIQTIEKSYADGAFYALEGNLECDYELMWKISNEIQDKFSIHEA